MSLKLNCANVIEKGKGISIPPKNAKQYPEEIGPLDLQEYIQKGGEILVIPVEKGKEQVTNKKEDTEKKENKVPKNR